MKTHTCVFKAPLSGTIRASWYQKGKTNLDFTEARDSEWCRHQLGHMQVCTSLQTDNHASTPPLSGQNNEIPTPLINANCNLNKSCITTYSVQILDNNAKVAGSNSKIHIIFHEYSLTFPSTYFNSIYVSIYAYLVSITLPAVADQRQKHI